ncbi:MAG TPA: hypothetical protein IAA30_07295 [Candidatus Treponema faecavium]|nr:hypothetical protein [Candidatus Treponema faecavium]
MCSRIRKAIALCVLGTVFLFTLSASPPWSFGLFMGWSAAPTAPIPVVYGAVGTAGPLAMLFQYQPAAELDCTLRYTFSHLNMVHDAELYTEYVPSEGGMTALAYRFRQSFTWSWFTLGYALLLQVSALYSPYSSLVTWAVAPSMAIWGTCRFDPFKATVFASFNHPLDRAFKFRPYAGVRLSLTIARNHEFFADGYVGAAEIVINRITVIDKISVRAGYRFIGGTE